MGRKHSQRTRPDRPARLDFGSGGWVLVLAVLLISTIFLWRISDMLRSRGVRATGDGRHPETYGFDLRHCRLSREQWIGSGLPRDGLPVLDMPPVWNRAVVDSLAHAGRNKYLVSGDRVIGVLRHGRARAYPLLILNWHEVVNDTLGGDPIAVTYNPLCDAAVVYDRRLRAADGSLDTVSLGHSGMLYNSDLLLYDRKPDRLGESLWIQLTGEAVSGPAAEAGARLAPLPSQLVRWADWKERYPSTTVLARDPARKERYRTEPYISYYGNDLLRFPVSPLPPREGMPYKTPCVVLEGAGAAGVQARVYPLPEIAGRVGADGRWRTEWLGVPVVFTYNDRPPAVWVDADPARLVARHTFWFAWYAMEGGVDRNGTE